MKLFFSSYILHSVIFCCVFSTISLFENSTKADNITNIIDGIESGKIKINYKNTEKNNLNNNKENPEQSIETYAGMVGNKKNSKTITLDLSMEHRENGSLLLINGNNLDNQKIIKTTIQEKPKRFLIDVFFQPKQEKIVNFTYQLPKDIRLKYGLQDFGGYRIALDLPSDYKIATKQTKKNEISVKFISQTLIEEQKKKQEEIKNKIKSNNNNTNKNEDVKITIKDTNRDNITIIDNFEGLKNVSKNATFQQIYNEDNRKIVVAIDAGHGGIDPGTIGKRKMPEKTITLMYARRLKEVLEQNGFKAILTRNNDKTIQLAKRVEIAKQARADLFISLHTDAHENTKITGTTVYRLSHLDEKHPDWNRFKNASYLPNNYSKYLNNSNVLDILIGMTHQSLLEKSTILTENILLDLKNSGLCKYCRHGQRSLAVLRGLDMVSILIEIGYITNKDEEIKLLSSSNVEKFSQSIANTLVKTYNVKQNNNNNQQRRENAKTNANNTNNTKKEQLKINEKSVKNIQQTNINEQANKINKTSNNIEQNVKIQDKTINNNVNIVSKNNSKTKKV